MIPYSIEVERELLAGLMAHADVMGLALDRGLHDDDFQKALHRRVYGAVRAIYEAGGKPAMIGVIEFLRGHDEGLSPGEYGEIMRWPESASPVGYTDHIEAVLNGSVARRLEAAAEEVRRAAKRGGDRKALLDAAEERILSLASRNGETQKVMTITDLASSYPTAREREVRGVEVGGGAGGLTDLQRLLGGLRPSRLYVMASRPGVGKSALSLNMIYHAAKQGVATTYINLEMCPMEITERLAGIAGNVRIRLEPGEPLDALFRGLGKIHGLPIYIRDVPGIGLAGICAMLRADVQRRKVGLAVIDYLQLITGERRETREQEVAGLSRGFKLLARQLQIPILLIAQLNREGIGRPHLHHLRESGAIEQDTDVALLLWPEKAGDIVNLDVAKHRGGPTGFVKLAYNKTTQRFTGVA